MSCTCPLVTFPSPADTLCKIVIRPKPGRDGSGFHPTEGPIINLNEIVLFTPSAGSAVCSSIPNSAVAMELSSTYASKIAFNASRCNDGDITDGGDRSDGGLYAVGCHSSPSDTNPTLTATYTCGTGITSLCRVWVFNRNYPPESPYAIGRIGFLQMDFYSAGANGTLDYTYNFTGSADNYTITPPGMHRHP